jgi:predicted lactoylglutathione lyase
MQGLTLLLFWSLTDRLYEVASRGPGARYRPVVEQRVSVITLGVADVAASRRFYESLGWASPCEPDSAIVFFQAGGMVVALWSRESLAEDSGVEDGGGWGGVTLAYNVRSPAEVDAVVTSAKAAGARIPRSGGTTFWGGYSGVFVDRDGHPWEVAYNPGWPLAKDGSIVLPA